MKTLKHNIHRSHKADGGEALKSFGPSKRQSLSRQGASTSQAEVVKSFGPGRKSREAASAGGAGIWPSLPELPQRDSTLPTVGSSADHAESPSPALAAAPAAQQRQPDDIESAQRPGSSSTPSEPAERAEEGSPEAKLMYTLKNDLHKSHKADYNEAMKSFGPRKMSQAADLPPPSPDKTRQYV